MPSELKPCPKCKSLNVSIHNGVAFYVYCRDCRASTSHHRERVDAIAAWDQRPEPATPADTAERLANRMGATFTEEHIAKASEAVKLLSGELDITNADHTALWLEANALSPPLTHQLGWVACRIVEAYERAITPATPAGDEGLVEELAPAIDEACVAYQQAFKDEFSPSRWDVPSADMARAILPIIRRERAAAYAKGRADERARGSEPKGTFACPICGGGTPHGHTEKEIYEKHPANIKYRLQKLAASVLRWDHAPRLRWPGVVVAAGYDSQERWMELLSTDLDFATDAIERAQHEGTKP